MLMGVQIWGHLTSSLKRPFHSPHTSQLGKLPTWYRPPQSHGSARSFTCQLLPVR